VNDYNYDGISPREKQYFLICNNAATTNMRVNLTAMEFTSRKSMELQFRLSIYPWDTYRPKELLANTKYSNLTITPLVENQSVAYYSGVDFQCTFQDWYIVEVFNEDFTDEAVYNITFQSDSGIPFQPYNYLPLVEKDIIPGYITISYYENTDPWLYDAPTGNGRLTLMMDYSYIHGLYQIRPSGYRYFTLFNNVEDTPIFVGVTGYTMSSYDEYPQLTVYISDWETLKAGREDPDYINFNILNYSCGLKFTAKAGHTYQITVHNGDSDYDVVVNLTIWSIESRKIRFDQDLDAEPDNDQIRIRAYSQDPWLESRRLQRRVWTSYIFGGLGIGGGVFFTIFILKRRYS
jgi:hypothetical protein